MTMGVRCLDHYGFSRCTRVRDQACIVIPTSLVQLQVHAEREPGRALPTRTSVQSTRGRYVYLAYYDITRAQRPSRYDYVRQERREREREEDPLLQRTVAIPRCILIYAPRRERVPLFPSGEFTAHAA